MNYNPVNWFEIAVQDLERAKKFYSAVFKRNFEKVSMPGSEMYMFEMASSEKGSLGALVQSKENIPSKQGVIIYFTCEDVNKELSRVEEAGGIIESGKASIGEFGNIAMVIDSEGNRIGLHSNS